MSLIAEALRKAHLEAKQREAASRGGAPYVPGAGTAVRPDAGRGPSRGRWIAVLVGSNLLLAAAAVGVYQAAREDGPDEPPEEIAAVADGPETPAATVPAGPDPAAVAPGEGEPAPQAPERSEAAPATALETGADGGPSAGPTAPPAASTPVVDEAPPVRERPEPVAPPPAEAAPAPATASAPSAAAVDRSEPDRRAAPREPVRYTYGMTLLDGRRIQLNGIVGVGGGHRAMINDRMVGVGDRVEGYEVERIDRRGVALRKGDRAIYLEIP